MNSGYLTFLEQEPTHEGRIWLAAVFISLESADGSNHYAVRASWAIHDADKILRAYKKTIELKTP